MLGFLYLGQWGGPRGAGGVPSYPGRKSLGDIDVAAVPPPVPGRTDAPKKLKTETMKR